MFMQLHIIFGPGIKCVLGKLVVRELYWDNDRSETWTWVSTSEVSNMVISLTTVLDSLTIHVISMVRNLDHYKYHKN